MALVVFDVYGTLFDVSSVDTACEAAAPGKGAEVSRVWRAKQLEYTWLVTLMDRYVDFWEVTRRALVFALRQVAPGAGEADPEIDELMGSYLRLTPFSETGVVLDRIGSHTLAVLSNGSPRMLKSMLEAAGLRLRFAAVLSADQVRRFKPHPDVYALVPQELAAVPDEVWFVSGNSFDIVGAGMFGFRTCWVNRRGGVLDEMSVTPDATVASLEGLPKVLGAPPPR